MNITIFTLVTDDGGDLTSTVHGSYLDAVNTLRENFDPEGEYEEIPDEDLVEVMNTEAGFSAVVTDEIIDVPASALPHPPVVVDDVLDAMADSDMDEAVLIRIETEVDNNMWADALTAAFEPHEADWERIKTATIADAIDIVTAMSLPLEEEEGPQ